ncbi:MAG: aminoglycoside phosphotransferase family protein [Clostridia bacterium]|nr:aminoglycoside phosphotransferase family protein [Clostridia bacterium]MBQ8513056.1 aminoglycoside phosphotransferase family protein [Clostridia bacterium]
MTDEIRHLMRRAGLGKLIRDPEVLTGGHLHRMFGVTTERGRFAVKQLNPEIMARPDAMDNFIRSEEIAHMASSVIPACAAVIVDGCPVVHLEHRWMIFPHIDGVTVPDTEITAEMAHKIGGILAKLHGMTALPDETADQRRIRVWREEDDPRHFQLYNRWESLRVRKICGRTVLSHRDLEPKNILWQSGNPTLIDWEAAGKTNAAEDLFTTALYHSRTPDGISAERFGAFFRGYFTIASAADFAGCDWDAVSRCYYDLTDWLAYNLTREDRELGLEQAEWARNELIRFDDARQTLLGCIRDLTDMT